MRLLIVLLAVACSSHETQQQPPPQPSAPQQQQQPDPVGNELIPPELIMQHQSEIELTADQRTQIETAIRDTQQQIVPLQFAMESSREKLVAALKAIPADETAVLAAADETMSHENEVKHLHVRLMVRIRNVLTPIQIAKLRALRR